MVTYIESILLLYLINISDRKQNGQTGTNSWRPGRCWISDRTYFIACYWPFLLHCIIFHIWFLAHLCFFDGYGVKVTLRHNGDGAEFTFDCISMNLISVLPFTINSSVYTHFRANLDKKCFFECKYTWAIVTLHILLAKLDQNYNFKCKYQWSYQLTQFS